MQNLCIVQARMSSTRFPGKVLAPLGESTVIDTLLQRLLKSSNLDEVVLATSNDSTDDVLASHVKAVPVFRGSLEDVRSRYIFLAGKYSPKNVIRITGDCPLVCVDLVDQMLKIHELENSEYTSNCNLNPYPKGFDIEIMKSEVLFRNAFLTEDNYEKEHVTPWMYHSKRLKTSNFEFLDNVNNSVRNFSVDTKGDLEFLNQLEKKFKVSELSFIEIWHNAQDYF